jgi:hypothetical protein
VFWRLYTPDLTHPRPQRLTYSTISNSEPPFDYLQLHVGQSPRCMESCPRFEYLFLATYSSLPTTRPFLGPSVYAPTRRITLSLAGPTRISPPSVSPVPAFRPAIRRLPLGLYIPIFIFAIVPNPQPFLSHWQPLHITQPDLWPIGVMNLPILGRSHLHW